MAKETLPSDNDNAAEALRAVLIKRLALAGGLVAVLLSVLAFFDYLSKAGDEVEYPVFTEPVPVGPRKAITQPVTPAENLPEPPASEAAATTETPAAADDKPAEAAPAAVEAPPPPAPAATPAAVPAPSASALPSSVRENAAPPASTANPSRRTESQRPAPARPEASPRSSAPPMAPASSFRSSPARSVAEEVTASPPIQPTTPATESVRAASRTSLAERVPAESATAPAARIVQRTPRLFSGFVLQAGVFSSVQRAEELHARLTLSGVPSHVETRVQVGPFKTREEAEAAQVKLRELGIESVLVPARGNP